MRRHLHLILFGWLLLLSACSTTKFVPQDKYLLRKMRVKVELPQDAQPAKEENSQQAQPAKEENSQQAQPAKEENSQQAQSAKVKKSQQAQPAKEENYQQAQPEKDENSQKAQLQVPWNKDLIGFLSRGDVQKVVKINVQKGREEGTTNILVLMNETIFRFFNLSLTKVEFFSLFNPKAQNRLIQIIRSVNDNARVA